MKFNSVLELFGGLGLFLFGMKLMGEGLELAAGSKLKALIEKLTRNKYMGALVGIVVTAVIQSSSAMSVMVVGFVNAGVMTLSQAVGVILGANVGTTVTGIMIAINLTKIAPIAIFLGAIMTLFIKNDSLRHIGQIIIGFGILFLGMDLMGNAMGPLAYSDLFRELVTTFKNPIVGLLVGLIFTAIIQSSSASIGVLQALGMAGAVRLSNVVFVIYGQNIGTCVTALLSSIGTNKTARRTAIVHFLFNVFGAVFFTLVTLFLPLTVVIEKIVPGNVMAQISIVHVIFNTVCAAILLPMSDLLIKIACKIIPGEDEVQEPLRLKYLDSRILSTPPIAVSQVLKEVERMGRLAKANFDFSMQAFMKNDKKKIKEVYENEKIINFLNRRITEFIVKINSLDISDADRKMLGSLFHVISDFERIGDHSENICELSEVMYEEAEDGDISDAAQNEIKELYNMVTSIIAESIFMLSARKADESLVEVIDGKEKSIDVKTEEFRNNHIERLNKGECGIVSGTIFMDLLTNLERIADHSTNVAFSIFEKGSL